MDLGRLIRRGLKAAAQQAERTGETNVAAAVNMGRSGRTTAVYSDGKVTVVHRDGHTEVYQHDQDEPDEH